jgi:succinylglutamate desuccinylase
MIAHVTNRLAGAGLAPGAHVIADLVGARHGPLLVAVGGLHGNEPAGVIAARRVAAALKGRERELAGEVVMLAGNTRALERGARYVDADLNRRWTPYLVEELLSGRSAAPCSEDVEMRELLAALERAVTRRDGDGYFLDLHTSSAEGMPFATVGDTLRNRAFASHFPVPAVLGVEEQLDGTLLEYANNHGFVTLGFEAGQHADPASVENAEAALWIAMVAAGNLRREDVPRYAAHRRRLEAAAGGSRFVEVRYRHAVRPGDDFRMEPGFTSFDPVERGQRLATDWRGPVRSPESGMVLMPLYQPLGDDGFFVARDVRLFWMKLSAALRRLKVERLVPLLPGVRRQSSDSDTLFVHTRVARFFPLQVFHLLGYRKRYWSDGMLVVSRRSFDAVGRKPRA